MSVQILEDKEQEYKCLFCTTTMWAFGPIFYEEDNVEDFLKWCPIDPRKYTDSQLSDRVNEWRKEREG